MAIVIATQIAMATEIPIARVIITETVTGMAMATIHNQ